MLWEKIPQEGSHGFVALRPVPLAPWSPALGPGVTYVLREALGPRSDEECLPVTSKVQLCSQAASYGTPSATLGNSPISCPWDSEELTEESPQTGVFVVGKLWGGGQGLY